MNEKKVVPGVDELSEAPGNQNANFHALEVCFVALIGILVIAAFFEATTYKLVSSRTPFVIMVPLIILLVIQMIRLLEVGSVSSVTQRVGASIKGQIPSITKNVSLLSWLTALLATIVIAGHYIGIAAFVFVLTRVLSREALRPALWVTAGTTVLLFITFELGFDIELYRGLIYRYFAGYRVF